MNTGSQAVRAAEHRLVGNVRARQRIAGFAGSWSSAPAKKGPSGGSSNWGCGFLPTVHNGVLFRTAGDPVLFLGNPPGIDRQAQRDSLDTIRALNEKRLGVMGDPEIATRINSFEMAFRMQASAPDVVDISKEPKSVLEMYGASPGKPSRSPIPACWLADWWRRALRFVQIVHEAWTSTATWSAT